MIKGGFAGKILIVDLTRGMITEKKLDEELAERFIGGLGICFKLAADFIPPGCGPLAPENAIILGVGPLVGTSLPSTSRVFAVSRLPSSNTIGWCGAGGADFGCQLKNAGYDHIVILGKADRPVYLSIVAGHVEIQDAGHLWGRGVEDTCETLWEEYPHPAGVLAIGQGGENGVVFSMAFIDRIATLGRGGLGAVMGSKNLKAILVRGKKGIRVSDRREYKQLITPFLRQIREYPYLKESQRMGMTKSFPYVSTDIYQKIRKRRIACVSCPIGCKDAVEIADGDYQGTTVCSSSVINLFIPVIYGLEDYREAIRLVHLLDGYGLDTFEFFGVLKFAHALLEKGMIPPSDVDGEIDLLSLASLETWAERIALRQGFGDTLADGFNGMINRYGTEAKQYAPALGKGMHPYTGPGSALPWDLFGTMELGQILDPRGPHVGSGGSPTYFARRPLTVFYKHFERMGIPKDAFDRIIVGRSPETHQLKVGRLLKYSHSWFALLGSMGICVRAQINRFYHAELCAGFYEAVTGIPTTVQSLRERVNRIWTLYRMLNLRDGSGNRAVADIPEQWLRSGGFKEYVTEQPLNRTAIIEMIGDYYDEWGWDRLTGVPTEQLRHSLDL
ncbi:MAG: aldehyde ferredoxin oxidoreductase N-terminal domain-containing protein [bacterium]